MRPQRDEWRAMQAYYAAFTTGDRNAVLPAAELLTEVVAGGRRSPAILAALAHCLSLRAGYEFSDDINADLKEATSIAEEVLVVDPDSATAHLTLATVALLRNEPETAQDHARRAAELAAYHPSLLETAGTLTALAGGWDDGVSLIRQAMRLNPHLPGYMRQLIALDHLFSGDDALALAEASRIDAPTDEWGPYLRALALMGLGYRERAEAEMAQARAIEPSVLDERDEPMPTWVQLSPEQTQILKDRLQMFHSPD
jgi:tetratricopeptide (TPR) repeat protein